jgi:hypothetical protein
LAWGGGSEDGLKIVGESGGELRGGGGVRTIRIKEMGNPVLPVPFDGV